MIIWRKGDGPNFALTVGKYELCFDYWILPDWVVEMLRRLPAVVFPSGKKVYIDRIVVYRGVKDVVFYITIEENVVTVAGLLVLIVVGGTAAYLTLREIRKTVESMPPMALSIGAVGILAALFLVFFIMRRR